MAKTSIVIPSCNERFLGVTVRDLLAKAAGEIEIFVILDGGPLDPSIPTDPRVRVLRHEHQVGMRQSMNEAAAMATGDFLMKVDAHCIFAEGYDVALAAQCDGDWLAVPTRHSIDQDRWIPKARNFNYHYLTFPYALSMYGYGLHAKTFDHYHRVSIDGGPRLTENERINAERAAAPVDDLMSFQGSCWFLPLRYFRRLWPHGLDHANYYFYQEAQEVGLAVWMSGGRCVVNKTTWYAHLHKGRDNQGLDGRPGRGFFLNVHRKRQSEAYATDYWLNDRWPGATRTFASFITQFWPLLERLQGSAEAWPDDWQDPKYRQAFETRPADQIPAHT